MDVGVSAPDATNEPNSSFGSANFGRGVLDLGFIFALMLSFATLILNATYMSSYLSANSKSIESVLERGMQAQVDPETMRMSVVVRMIASRLALLSSGIFVAMSFGFLGFSLFLLGIRGEMNVQAGGDSYEVKIARMSPGVFVISCASILVGVCVTHSIPYEFTRSTSGSSAPQTSPNAVDPAAPGRTLDSMNEDNQKLVDEFLPRPGGEQ